MQWQFKGKPVQKEQYCWEAVYNDGTTLKQYDDQGKFHQFGEIDQGRLVVFKMVGDKTYTLMFEKGMKLIHYYDRYILQVGTKGETRMTAYCFGYERGKEKVVTMIFPNETIITSKPEKVKLQ